MQTQQGTGPEQLAGALADESSLGGRGKRVELQSLPWDGSLPGSRRRAWCRTRSSCQGLDLLL